jgi:transcriptional regulator of nitric oxide reductase
MKGFMMISLVLLALVSPGLAQAPEVALHDRVRRLFPNAAEISAKQSSPPHYKIFDRAPDGTTHLAGLAFLTTELEPLERGYDGPIKILVGLRADGVLSGIEVIENREPYGYFSVDTPQFAAQFAGKDLRDAFRVGEDIDAVSRASITMGSATRAIRNSARRIARQLLTPPPPR